MEMINSETQKIKTKVISVKDKNLNKDKAWKLSRRERLIFSKTAKLEVWLKTTNTKAVHPT